MCRIDAGVTPMPSMLDDSVITESPTVLLPVHFVILPLVPLPVTCALTVRAKTAVVIATSDRRERFLISPFFRADVLNFLSLERQEARDVSTGEKRITSASRHRRSRGQAGRWCPRARAVRRL